MSQPLVSVVIPTRDRPELLARAVASVADQGLGGQLECLVVCDRGHWPDVDELAAAANPRLLTNPGPPGAAQARNVGVSAARGQLVAFLDDDDRWRPGKLAAQLDALAADPKVVGALCGVSFQRGENCIPAALAPGRLSHRQLVRGRLSRWHLSTLVMRRAALPAPLFDEAIPGSYGEDYDLLLRLSAAGKIVTLAEPLVEVTQHPGSYFAGCWPTISRSIPYLLAKHPDLAHNRRGASRLLGRLAVAEAACGHPREACHTAWSSIRRNPRQLRPYLALALCTGLVDIHQIDRFSQRFGRSM